MKKLNNELKLGECQDHRIWIHSNTLGYGKWVATARLVSMIQSLSKPHTTSKSQGDGIPEVKFKPPGQHTGS